MKSNHWVSGVSLLCVIIGMGTARSEEHTITDSSNTSSFGEAITDEYALENPFKGNHFKLMDPRTHEAVDRVVVGPVFEVPEAEVEKNGYDYYRYVTFVNVSYRKEEIFSMPVIHEECHDRSEFFGNEAFTFSWSASVKAGIAFEGIGLDLTFTGTRTFTQARNLRATGGITADHTAFFMKQDWKGFTYLETFSKKTGKEMIVLKRKPKHAPWYYYFSPALAFAEERHLLAYPYEFEARDAKRALLIERSNVGRCGSTGFGNSESGYREEPPESAESVKAAHAAALNYLTWH